MGRGMDIAVASGKGGTGKTTISVSLAAYFYGKGAHVAILDCDVEEPNVNLFLKAPVDSMKKISVLIPAVDQVLCSGCGECERICAYSAIVLIKGKPLVLPDLCHSCGGCFHVCPEKAIGEIDMEIGVIETGSNGVKYAGGRLNIGAHLSPPLIKEVKKMHFDSDVRVIDCPPGTSCPVIASITGSSYALIVTEPTVAGIHDLKRVHELTRHFRVKSAVCVNKADINDEKTREIREYCSENGMRALAEIPYDDDVTLAQIAGKSVVEYSNGPTTAEIKKMWKEIENDVQEKG